MTIKNYEILEFKTSVDGGLSWNISRKISNGRYLNQSFSEYDLPLSGTTNDGYGAELDYMLNSFCETETDIVLIHKVIFKNQIFKIGDKINNKEIESFTIKNKCLHIKFKNVKNNYSREEVIILLYSLNNDKPGNFDCSKWIEENLI